MKVADEDGHQRTDQVGYERDDEPDDHDVDDDGHAPAHVSSTCAGNCPLIVGPGLSLAANPCDACVAPTCAGNCPLIIGPGLSLAANPCDPCGAPTRAGNFPLILGPGVS